MGSGGQDAKQDYIDGPLRPTYCSNASAFPVNYETWYPAYKTVGADPAQDSCRIPPSFVVSAILALPVLPGPAGPL